MMTFHFECFFNFTRKYIFHGSYRFHVFRTFHIYDVRKSLSVSQHYIIFSGIYRNPVKPRIKVLSPQNFARSLLHPKLHPYPFLYRK